MPTADELTYPNPRYERNPPSSYTPSVPAARTATPPRMRHFLFDLAASAGTRSTNWTPRLNGRCIVRRMGIVPRTTSDPPTHAVEVGYGVTPVNEQSVSLAVGKPYSSLMERVVGVAGGINANLIGVTEGTIERSITTPAMFLDLIVPASDPCVSVTVYNASVIAMASWEVTLTVLENVSPDALLNFL